MVDRWRKVTRSKRAGRKRKVPINLPGMEGRKFVKSEVPDPLEPGAVIEVLKASNDTPLAYLFHRKRLHAPGETVEDANARLVAGVWVRERFELAGGAGARAIDYSAIKVDTSSHFDGLTDTQAKAFKTMAELEAFMGPYRYELVHAICCDQIPLMQWLGARDRARGMPGRQDRLDAYQELRNALDRVIDFRGVAVGPSRARRVSRETIPTD